MLERRLRHNGLIALHIKEEEINYFHILELAAQYIKDFWMKTSSPLENNDIEYNKSSDD